MRVPDTSGKGNFTEALEKVLSGEPSAGTADISYINVGNDTSGNVQLRTGGTVLQGLKTNSFNGLSLGGSNYSSTIKHVLSEDTSSVLSYELADLRIYHLGLSNTHIDTLAPAQSAIHDLKEANNRVSAERSKLGAFSICFQHVLDSHRQYIANMTTAENQICNLDVAAESATMSSMQVRHSIAMSVIAQFNSLSKNVLALIQP